MKVTIYDYSNYQAGRSSNGGQYGFWEEYSQAPFEKDGQPAFTVDYNTTADFDYCHYCGSWDSNCHCGDVLGVVSLSELQEIMKKTDLDPSEQVYYRVEGELKSVDWVKVRRRVEDCLRKTADNNILFKVASLLNVKVW